MWLVIITKSELIKMRRLGTGVVRGILNIAEDLCVRTGLARYLCIY